MLFLQLRFIFFWGELKHRYQHSFYFRVIKNSPAKEPDEMPQPAKAPEIIPKPTPEEPPLPDEKPIDIPEEDPAIKTPLEIPQVPKEDRNISIQ